MEKFETRLAKVEKTLNNIKSIEPNTKKYYAMKFACQKAK